MSYRDALREWRRQYFAALLFQHDGRVASVAKAIGVNRTHLHRQLINLGLRQGLSPNRGNRGNETWQALAD
jgi:DNA-binding NtrC family response regulator